MLPLQQLLTGPLNFLLRDAEELRRIVPDADRSLPPLQRIYLEDEGSTPLVGFPVLATPELRALERAFEQYAIQEEEVELAVLQRAAFDSQAFQGAWESYRLLLMRAAENVTTASYGRSFPAIFWLWHSAVMARVFKDAPRRILRRNSASGREHGDALKYRVYQKVIDRLTNLNYEMAQHLSSDTDEEEEQLFPALFTRMRDNVLVLTEDHVSPNLVELGSYFAGCLRLDGRDFRTRLLRVSEWYADELRRDPELARLAAAFGLSRTDDPRTHLNRPGLLTFLAARPGYDEERLLPSRLVHVWENLLLKLKEFEILHALRRSIVLCERQSDALLGRVRAAGAGPSAGSEWVRLSSATRPLDFMAPWVVDPLVSRFGLIYDISDFTETVTVLRRSGSLEQDRSFRMMFRFQRKVNRLATQHRAKLEKYLGDGAFYSSREARHMVALALLIQRAYREALTRGFPFSKGLRLALNHGQYRLLPIRIGAATESERYEFFGHGVVELTRLTTGKSARDIEEIKNLLVTYGYPETTVNRFFAPMVRHNIDVVEKDEHERGFYAYINENGTLVNEGIVATGDFVARFAGERAFERVFRLVDRDRTWIAVKLDVPGQSLLAGLRKLGVAQLKGLDNTPIYEIVDATLWGDNTLLELRGGELVDLVEREFRATLGA
ncbi:MAG: hypothetical protein H6Q03_2141 [Acidobacteria bacterium]|nr:hypothetical protein [Acidobacteriota bacterium]